MFQRLKQDLKNDLIAGLLVVIPLATTIWLTSTIARWAVTVLTRIPRQVNPLLDIDPILGNLMNLLIGLTVPLLFILLIGLMARNIAGRWLLDLGEQVLQAIPFAGSIYKTLKQLLETILRDSKGRFRRVVLLEYPRPGIWAIAFVTGTVGTSLQSHLIEPMLSVFVPTTPNPTTGWYAIVPENQVLDTELSVEDAFKILISGGIVAPNVVSSTNRDNGQDSNQEAENQNEWFGDQEDADVQPKRFEQSGEGRHKFVNVKERLLDNWPPRSVSNKHHEYDDKHQQAEHADNRVTPGLLTTARLTHRVNKWCVRRERRVRTSARRGPCSHR